jgi:addiction module RelE/StbE family toxin
MKREFDFTPHFLKKAAKLLKGNLALDPAYEDILNKLLNDPFDPKLHTHLLTGNLKGRYACSLTYELRIVFSLQGNIIKLLNIGSHDDVY